jgi:DNA repair protein RadA/Sms
MGFCPQCRGSNTLAESVRTASPAEAPVPVGEISADAPTRLRSGIEEFDRVLGGGLIPGSVVLFGGAPGVGKSTLVLVIGAALAESGASVLLATGEESRGQVALRAGRIGAQSADLLIAIESRIGPLSELIRSRAYPVVVIDSIQTVTGSSGTGGAGTAGLVRDTAAQLIQAAKESGVALVLIGHITKDGSIAGPKSLEHMVDVVLSLDGDPLRNLRFLRGTKNRFGSVNEIGVFEMTGRGLQQVVDPSAHLAGVHATSVAGSVLFPALDGRRSLLVEIQALAVPTRAAQPRRSVKGLTPSRVHQIIASIDRHAKISMGNREVYVSVMGGITVAEPAADLPTAVAIASAVSGIPLGTVAAWGEVALTGEVRAVDQADRRRSECRRLGVARTVEGGDGRTLAEILHEVGLGPGNSGAHAGLRAVPAGGNEAG